MKYHYKIVVFSVFIFFLTLLLIGIGFAQEPHPNPTPNPLPSGHDTYMQPYKHNAYGIGVHSDATGKPFKWETRDGQTIEPWNRVKPDGYGLGVGIDEYGRAVKPRPWGQ